MRRRTALAGMAALAMPGIARAQDTFPSRPVRVVVPFAPGASSDTLARLITAKATAPLGGSFVVENRAGAGGLIAAQFVAHAAPDGYTLLWGGGTAITHAVMQANPGYDVLKDFTPIIALFGAPGGARGANRLALPGHRRAAGGGEDRRRAGCAMARAASARPRTWPPRRC